MAIEHAHRILDWQQNLQLEEIPPVWMWPFEEELEIWFDEVEEKRKDKYGGGGGDSSDESVPMMSNELAKDRKK
jgi:hypothetical protein